jgi:hypothetical protein
MQNQSFRIGLVISRKDEVKVRFEGRGEVGECFAEIKVATDEFAVQPLVHGKIFEFSNADIRQDDFTVWPFQNFRSCSLADPSFRGAARRSRDIRSAPNSSPWGTSCMTMIDMPAGR